MAISELDADTAPTPVDASEALIREARVHRRRRNAVVATSLAVLTVLGLGVWAGLGGPGTSASPVRSPHGPGAIGTTAAAKAADRACATRYVDPATGAGVVAAYATSVGILERARWDDQSPAGSSRYSRYPKSLSLAVCVVQSPRGGATWTAGCPPRFSPRGPIATRRARLIRFYDELASCKSRAIPGPRRFMQTIAVSAAWEHRIEWHGDTLPGFYGFGARIPFTAPPTLN
jgi:hypothetical protein